MNTIKVEINIDTPTGKRILNDLQKHPKTVKVLNETDPISINPPSEMTHKQIWKNMESKLNKHYGSDLKFII
jgi:hypothetical protein